MLNVRLCVHLDMGKYVGERIREARKAAKMSQEELAQGVRVRRQTIGEYENGGESRVQKTVSYALSVLTVETESATRKTSYMTVAVRQRWSTLPHAPIF